MTELTPTQRRALRAAAHHLSPVVSIAQKGLAESVLKEIDRCLATHELIKVKLHGIERDDREALLGEICGQLGCAPIQHIGNILVLWRKKPAEEAAATQPAPRTRRSPKPLTKKQAVAALERPRRKTTRT